MVYAMTATNTKIQEEKKEWETRERFYEQGKDYEKEEDEFDFVE